MKNSEARLAVSHHKVLRLLEIYRRSLVEAGTSKDILDAYSRILKFAKELPTAETAPTFKKSRAASEKSKDISSEDHLLSLSLDDIERIVQNKETPRSLLEAIAIGRFDVPRGSMRSFSNMDMLRERILTRIRNERAHQTISSVASQYRQQ